MNETITIGAALLSATAAIFALWLSVRANKIAQNSLELAQKQDTRRRPNFEIYIADTYFKHIEGSQFRLYVFHIQISNNSAADNSIRNVELIIDGVSRERTAVHTKIVLAHHHSLATLVSSANINPLTTPASIGAFAALDGHVLFKLASTFTQEFDIDTYLLTLSDIQGFKSQIEPILIREENNG